MEEKYLDLLMGLIQRHYNKAKPLYYLVLEYLSEDIAKENNAQPTPAIEDTQNSRCEVYRNKSIEALRKICSERRLCQIYTISTKMLERDQG